MKNIGSIPALTQIIALYKLLMTFFLTLSVTSSSSLYDGVVQFYEKGDTMRADSEISFTHCNIKFPEGKMRIKMV